MAISSNISELDNTIPLSTELLEDIYIIGSDVNSSSIKVDPTKRATVAVTDIQEFAAKVDLLVKEDSKINSSLISFNKLNERLIPENLNLQYKQVSISPIGLDEVLSSDATYVNVVAEAPYVGLKAVNIEQPKLNDIQVALSPGALKAANVYVEGRSSADSVVIYNTDPNFYGLRTVTITDLPISSLISHTVTPGELSTSDTITINGVSDEAFGTAAVEVNIPLISSGHFLINTNTLANQPLKPSAGDYALDGTRLDEGTIALGYKTVSFDVDLAQLSSESIIAKAKDGGGILEPSNTAIGYDSVVIPALSTLPAEDIIRKANRTTGTGQILAGFGFEWVDVPQITETESTQSKLTAISSGETVTTTGQHLYINSSCTASSVSSAQLSDNITLNHNTNGLGFDTVTVTPVATYDYTSSVTVPVISDTADDTPLVIESIDPNVALRKVTIPAVRSTTVSTTISNRFLREKDNSTVELVEEGKVLSQCTITIPPILSLKGLAFSEYSSLLKNPSSTCWLSVEASNGVLVTNGDTTKTQQFLADYKESQHLIGDLKIELPAITDVTVTNENLKNYIFSGKSSTITAGNSSLIESVTLPALTQTSMHIPFLKFPVAGAFKDGWLSNLIAQASNGEEFTLEIQKDNISYYKSTDNTTTICTISSNEILSKFSIGLPPVIKNITSEPAIITDYLTPKIKVTSSDITLIDADNSDKTSNLLSFSPGVIADVEIPISNKSPVLTIYSPPIFDTAGSGLCQMIIEDDILSSFTDNAKITKQVLSSGISDKYFSAIELPRKLNSIDTLTQLGVIHIFSCLSYTFTFCLANSSNRCYYTYDDSGYDYDDRGAEIYILSSSGQLYLGFDSVATDTPDKWHIGVENENGDIGFKAFNDENDYVSFEDENDTEVRLSIPDAFEPSASSTCIVNVYDSETESFTSNEWSLHLLPVSGMQTLALHGFYNNSGELKFPSW